MTAATETPPMTPQEAVADAACDRVWAGTVVVEGPPTGDGRAIVPFALNWPDLDTTPVLLGACFTDIGGHDAAQIVGRFKGMERRTLPDGTCVLYAWGTFDLGSDAGREAARMMDEGFFQGVSVDLDSVESEIGMDDTRTITAAQIRGATLVRIPAFHQASLSAYDPAALSFVDGYSLHPAERQEAKEAGLTMPDGSFPIRNEDDLRNAITANGRAADIPAARAWIKKRAKELGRKDLIPESWADRPTSIEASAATGRIPVNPPREWFDNPNLTGPTSPVWTADGRVYGHIATWDTAHVAMAGEIRPPKNYSGYRYFHTGSLVTAEGETIPVGRLVAGGGHPGAGSLAQAAQHYDDHSAVVIDARVGEDAYGIWFAGAARPGMTEAALRELRASAFSGDWRLMDGQLELITALAVAVGGYPVPNPRAYTHDQTMYALTASAGWLPPNPAYVASLSADEITELRGLVKDRRAAQARAAFQTAMAARKPAIMKQVAAVLAAKREGI